MPNQQLGAIISLCMIIGCMIIALIGAFFITEDLRRSKLDNESNKNSTEIKSEVQVCIAHNTIDKNTVTPDMTTPNETTTDNNIALPSIVIQA